MADQGDVSRVRATRVEEGFKAAGGAGKEEGFQSRGHIIFYTKSGNVTTETPRISHGGKSKFSPRETRRKPFERTWHRRLRL